MLGYSMWMNNIKKWHKSDIVKILVYVKRIVKMELLQVQELKDLRTRNHEHERAQTNISWQDRVAFSFYIHIIS